MSRRWIMQEVESSLRRLGTDWIDLYQVHRYDTGTDLEETLGALDDLVRQGKVRYVGSSTFPASTIVEAQWVSRQRGLQRYVSEQPPYSMLVRGIEADVLPTAQRYGMAVIPWSPLSGGWLTGRYRKGADIAEPTSAARRRLADRYDLTLPANQAKLEAADQLAQLAEEAGIPLVQLAIAWVARHPAMTSPIIGPRTMEQLEGQLPAADLVIEDALLDRIDEIVPPGVNINPADGGWQNPALEAVGAAAVGVVSPLGDAREVADEDHHERPVAHPQRGLERLGRRDVDPDDRAVGRRRHPMAEPHGPDAPVPRTPRLLRRDVRRHRHDAEEPDGAARTRPDLAGIRAPTPRAGAAPSSTSGRARPGAARRWSAGARLWLSYVSIGVLRPGRLRDRSPLSHS